MNGNICNGYTDELIPHEKVVSLVTMPTDDAVRARKVVRTSNHGHVVKFASMKCRRIIEAESLLEYDRFILLETTPHVVLFQEQPFKLEYEDNGVIKAIYPDVLVIRRDGSKTIEEIKPSELVSDPCFERRIQLEKKVLAQHGYDFSVQTELEIRKEPRLSNAKKLLTFRRRSINPLHLSSVADLLCDGALTVKNLIENIPGLTPEDVWVLAAHGHVIIDLGVPLGISSKIQALEGELYEL